jgi:hypothetical protein
MALVGTVAIRINNRPAVTATDFSESLDRPGQVKAGGYGPIGTSEGVETGSGSFKFRPRTENGMEFPIDELRRPFTVNYPLGTQRFALLNCKYTRLDVNVQQQTGDVEVSVAYVYEQKKQTR